MGLKIRRSWVLASKCYEHLKHLLFAIGLNQFPEHSISIRDIATTSDYWI